jgi:predicted Zn-dependent protease with MMP-like domain
MVPRPSGIKPGARPLPKTPPSLDELHTIAEAALAALPAPFAGNLDGVVIRVDEFPDAETEEEMGLESPFDILGLYRGIAIGRKANLAVGQDVDMIFLYRRPILDYWCETGDDLAHVVRHVLIHEIGHHFGLSDADMERIEATA